MSKKVLTIIGLMMMVLLLAMPLYASTAGSNDAEQEYAGEDTAGTIHVGDVGGHKSPSRAPAQADPAAHAAKPQSADSVHGSSTHGSQATQTSQHAQPAYNTGQGHQGAAENVTVKAVPVKLADAETIRLLRTDWLKEAQEEHRSTEKVGFSGAFWTVMGAVVALSVLGLVLFFGGTFNRFGLNLKLYASYGSLVLLAAMLGVSGYFYLSSVNRTAHLEAALLEMDMMGSEMFSFQDEFLLHGIENKAYGEKQVAKVNALLNEYREDFDAIRSTGHLDADVVQNLDKIETLTGNYGKDFEGVVKAYHEIEADKEELDELGEKVDEALEEMIHHHESMLAALEAQGTDMREIAYQTRIVEHLNTVKILSLKVAKNEVGFLLDKHADRVEAMEKDMGLLKGYLKALEEELRSKEEKALLKKIEEEIESYIVLLKAVIRNEAVVEKDTAEMREQIHRIKAITGRLSHQLEVMADGMQREAEIALLALVGIALSIGTLLAVFITRSISKPINRIIGGLNEGAEQVASASGQVSSSSQQLAEGSSEQAASIEETSSSLEEMASMTKQNADNANQADNLMKEANQVVTKANDSMTELTGSMEEISKASEETSKIIKTIDEIAFQTNLLALNAAVEAARAGEAGAGFAVVADEVRNLAMRAADAAKNTAELIEGTVKKVNEGGDLVATTNEAFTQVAESSSKVGELVGEIAAASQEQAGGIEQVNKAVVEMDKVVQQNAANAEENASASEEMSAQSEQMMGFVGELVALVGGSKDAADSGRAAKIGQSKTKTYKAVAAPVKATKGKEVVVRGANEVRPDQVIPMDDQDFKDF